MIRRIRRAERSERFWQPFGPFIGHVQRFRLAQTWGVFVHSSAEVGRVRFAHPTSVVIGAGVVIEDDVLIYQNVTVGAADRTSGQYPTIRRGATLFAGCTVLGNVEVGEGAIVGAHSLVLSDVKAGTTVVGTPARATT